MAMRSSWECKPFCGFQSACVVTMRRKKMASKKTTVEISESLFREARELAPREGITLRMLIERALRQAMAETRRREPFKLRDASFEGRGLQAEFQDASWEQLRDLISLQ
jgi:hypothetical protein